ncbi:MAG: ECF-type sigma factor [Planctomycetota bacterium]
MEEQLTDLLNRWSHGDDKAGEAAARTVDPEIKKLARSLLGKQPWWGIRDSDVVGSAWVRFLKWNQTPKMWNSRSAFLGAFHILMKQSLMQLVRSRQKDESIPLDAVSFEWDDERYAPTPEEWLDLEQALEDLRKENPRRADIIEMKAFGAYPAALVAEALELAESTVYEEWKKGKRWLARRLRSLDQPGESQSRGSE